jgi:NADH-quinone oxidoreductase subunit G
MCDYGRINTYKFINDQSRIDGPYLRKEGKPERVSWRDAYSAAVSGLKRYSRDQIAFIASPYITNEDLFAFTKFARSLGVKNIDFMRHIDPSFGDDLLRRDDMTPNTSGAELILKNTMKGSADLRVITDKINAGNIKAVYLLEDDIISADPSLESIFAKLELLIVNSTNFNRVTELAHVIFPAATYAEKNGTIINFQGRLQRLRPAITTVEMDRGIDGLSMSRLDKFGTKFDKWAEKNKRDAYSSWKIITGLANAAGHKFNYQMAEDVFDEITSSIPLFNGITYDDIAELGINLKLNIMQPEKV